MKIIFDGSVTPTGPFPIKISVKDSSTTYINVYNMAPYSVYLSLTLGLPDIFVPPYYAIEGLFIGKQGGANLTVNEQYSTAQQIYITNVESNGITASSSPFAIMGFRKDENWQGVKPLITSGLAPTLQTAIANQVINTGNSPGTIVLQSNSSPGFGAITMNNDGSGTRSLLDNGVFLPAESFVNGTNITPAVATYGNTTDLDMTTFNGKGNFDTLSFNTYGNVNGIPVSGGWFSIGHQSGLNITDNAAHNLFNISAPVTGLFRVSCYFNKQNVTSSAVNMTVHYTDPVSGGTANSLSTANGGTVFQLNGGTSLTAVRLMCFTVTFPATISTGITVSYQSPSGTSNDWVYGDLEMFTT